MTPAQFLARLQKREIPALCLFLGCEAWERRRCREALMAAHPGADGGDQAVTRYDAGQTKLSEIVDDARAMSLFSAERLILVTSAEAALPRGAQLTEDDGDEDSGGSAGTSDALSAYAKDPMPGVVLLFEATRFDLEGEDKRKSDRVRKYYAAVPDVVEFKRLAPEEAMSQLRALAARMKIQLEAAAAGMLVEALAADMTRIGTELEKLAAFAGAEGSISAENVIDLIPDARESTVFALVNALGRCDRARALASLDALCRENEYLPLALAFLSTQFRQALAAQESNLRTATQVQSHFSKAGIAMWGSRAEQVAQTAQKFSREQLRAGLGLIFSADRDLRNARPDDRVVMEDFVIRLTA